MMLKNKKYYILIMVLVVVVITVVLIRRTDQWEPPRTDWAIRFESIEEIEEIKRLLDEGSKSELLEFMEGINNGENIIESKRDMEYFLEIISDTFLPTDPNWVSLSYYYGLERIFIMYDIQDEVSISFIMRPRGGDETFEDAIQVDSEDFVDVDITKDIAAFSNLNNFDEDSLYIGNGVEAFSFYNQWGDYSILVREDGWEVRVSLNVDGIFVSARIDHAPTLEDAFEILANIEFSLGGGWFDDEQ